MREFIVLTQTEKVLDEIEIEREAQTEKWGEQNHPDGTSANDCILEDIADADLLSGTDLATVFKDKCKRNTPEQDNWKDILLEEVFEAMAETDPVPLREELIQVAAVAVAWIEAIDRRSK